MYRRHLTGGADYGFGRLSSLHDDGVVYGHLCEHRHVKGRLVFILKQSVYCECRE